MRSLKLILTLLAWLATAAVQSSTPFDLAPRSVVHRLGFVHVQKTGGTATLNPLRNWANRSHSGLKSFDEDNLWVGEICKRAPNQRTHDFWVGSFREPIARAESQYFQIMGKRLKKSKGTNPVWFIHECSKSKNFQFRTLSMCLPEQAQELDSPADFFDLAWPSHRLEEAWLLMAVLVPGMRAEQLFVTDVTSNRRSHKPALLQRSLISELEEHKANVSLEMDFLRKNNEKDNLLFTHIQSRFTATVEAFGAERLQHLVNLYREVQSLIQAHYLPEMVEATGRISHDFELIDYILKNFTVQDFLYSSPLTRDAVKNLNDALTSETSRLISLEY